MSWRRDTGDSFEARALQQLEQAGLILLDRNFNTRYGELDLVMRDTDTVVFVEVRYRRGEDFGGALASVTAGKRKRLVLAARLYLQTHPQLAQQPCRFDVLAFAGPETQPESRWLRNAFDAF
ncbi:MAG: YraN family protein [Rhodanobacteraceae bacterium]